jgi:hypothetical protein
MFPLIPILLIGGGVFAGLKATENPKLRKKVAGLFKKADNRYQRFLQRHVDPLFGTKQRSQQMQEFSGDYNAQEANVNRRLGLSVVNAGIAVLGALFYPPLLLVLINAVGLIYIVWPIMYKGLLTFIQEKRFKYWLFGGLSVIAGLLGGFYVVSSLMIVLVFLAFKVAARTEAYSQTALMDTFSLQPPASVWMLVDGIEWQLEKIKEEKDLGVWWTDDLKPSRQCAMAAKKATSVLGLIRRNFKLLDVEEFMLLYKAYIRPHIEYCVQSWSPYLQRDITCLEQVQRRATKIVGSLKKKSYEERLKCLRITTLEDRRGRGDLIETYKILTGKEHTDYQQFFQFENNGHGLRGHSLKLFKKRSK